MCLYAVWRYAVCACMLCDGTLCVPVRLMVTGYRRDMEEADLWLLPPSDQIGHLVPTFQQLWAQEQSRCDRANR